MNKNRVIVVAIATMVLCLMTTPMLADMALIPAGEYVMGRHMGSGDSDELPIYDVYINSFYMDVYEVTNEQYWVYLNSSYGQGLIEVIDYVVYKAGGSEPYCNTHDADPKSRIHWNGSTFTITSDKEYHPVVEVSWYGAVAYANWQSYQEGKTPCYDLETWTCDFDAEGYRLPTEAEWERSARGDEHDPYSIYPWGDTIDGSQANYWESGDPFEGILPETTPVGYYNGYQTPAGEDMANGYGLYDMAGNVYEWCNDWYDAEYYQYCVDTGTYNNPQGPASTENRVIRSGSWFGGIAGIRCANRFMSEPYNSRYGNVGFRLAMNAHTVSATLTCLPSSGTIPLSTQISVTMNNLYSEQARTIAGQIDVTLAGGGYFPNWRAGYTNVAAGDSYIISWNQDIPNIGTLIGVNTFQLLAEDVTPAPYNQPPYPPAGDTETASCTVTGMAPEQFDYGPPYENWEAETIGLEMLGADGELLLPQEMYDRINRDLDLIRALEPALADQLHTPAWALNQLIIQKVPGEPSAEYDALNTYFQMTEEEHLFGDWYVLTFAGNSNIPALAQLYLELAAVEYAEPNGIIGGENYWSPTELLGGTWNWDIDDGWHDCFDGCDCHRHYIFEVDAGGAVTLTYYEEWGYPYCEF